jgi:hypothetical protein
MAEQKVQAPAKRRRRRTTKRKRSITPYRARRVSGLKKFDFNHALIVAAGGAAAGFIDKLIPESWNLKPEYLAGGKMVIGAIVPELVKNPKQKETARAFGDGLIAVGTYQLMQSLGLIEGTDYINEDLKDDDLLVVTLDGVTEDVEFEDVNEETDPHSQEDLNVVNEMFSDIPIVNDDILSYT